MQIIRYSNEKPPVYQKCVERFGISWQRGVIITYGDTVHCMYQIPDHLKIHEGVHVEQQLKYPGGKEAWWERYFADPTFRLEQEVPAYRAQIAFAHERMNRSERRKLKDHILHDMVHSYGKMCSKETAENLLYN